MEFDKIVYDGKGGELDYTEMYLPKLGAPETKQTVQAKVKDPTPAFKRALQAFTSYVIWVIGAPPEWKDTVEIRGVTIKRPEDGERGIVVTALHTCKHANKSTLTINTPFLSEKPDGYSGDGANFLSAKVVGFIDDLEQQAELYLAGERGEQTSLPLGSSENTDEFNERSASAEAKSTRKPKDKSGKKSDQMPGVGLVANPDETEPVTDIVLRQMLLSVERDVPIDVFPTWTASERDSAVRWAKFEQRRLLHAVKPDEKAVKEPKCVVKSATLALKADDWTEPAPPSVDEHEADAMQRVDVRPNVLLGPHG